MAQQNGQSATHAAITPKAMMYTLFLIVHITAGSIGLLTGPAAILTKKGGWAHRKAGIIFFYAMLIVSGTALVLGVLHHIPFLFVVGIFSAYLNTTGYRVLYQKQHGQLHQTTRFDHAISFIMLLFSMYFLLYGTYGLIKKDPFGLVFLFFAVRSLQMLWQDWKLFTHRAIQPTTWLNIHLTRMIGTCVAAFTAFAVVNSSSRLSLIGWLLPALIGLPLAAYWRRRVSAKTSVRQPVPPVMA